MAGNSIGKLFTLTTFGESHGDAIGGIIDGCPSHLEIDEEFIRNELAKRKPGQSDITTQRKENDEVKFLSGIFEGKTTGTPIGFTIWNQDQKSEDYAHLKDNLRPSHADFTYQSKYGTRDYRGGGRSSARETACRVVAGAIAKLYLAKQNISVDAYVSKLHKIELLKSYQNLDLSKTYASIVRCPDDTTSRKMIEFIETLKQEGDTAGGIITCIIKNVPLGLGEPVFDKLHADIGKAMLSINSVKGFEYGTGFDITNYKGSEANDIFNYDAGYISTYTNNSGGIQGGISNGQDIYFKVAFKPVATIMQEQKSVNTKGEEVVLEAKGRHDPCVLPRAVPIVESMAAIIIMDHFLRNKIYKHENS